MRSDSVISPFADAFTIRSHRYSFLWGGIESGSTENALFFDGFELYSVFLADFGGIESGSAEKRPLF
jgi:hypothetical protein